MQAGKFQSLLLLGVIASGPVWATSASVSTSSIQDVGLTSSAWSVSGLAGTSSEYAQLGGHTQLPLFAGAEIEAPGKPQVTMTLGEAKPVSTVAPVGSTLATEVFKPSLAARERGAKGFDSATLFLAGGLALLGTVLFRSRIFS